TQITDNHLPQQLLTDWMGTIGWVMMGAALYIQVNSSIPPERRAPSYPALFNPIDSHFYDNLISSLYEAPLIAHDTMGSLIQYFNQGIPDHASDSPMLNTVICEHIKKKNNVLQVQQLAEQQLALLDHFVEATQVHRDITCRVQKQQFDTSVSVRDEINLIHNYVLLIQRVYTGVHIDFSQQLLEGGCVHFGILSRLCHYAIMISKSVVQTKPMRIIFQQQSGITLRIELFNSREYASLADEVLQKQLHYYYPKRHHLTEQYLDNQHSVCQLHLPLDA
ncbi:MAG: hypothetical protein RIG62_00005, partial [Cyclobacteriaceae bacterium]